MLLFIYFDLFIFFQNDRIKTIVILYTLFVLVYFYIFRQYFYVSFPPPPHFMYEEICRNESIQKTTIIVFYIYAIKKNNLTNEICQYSST